MYTVGQMCRFGKKNTSCGPWYTPGPFEWIIGPIANVVLFLGVLKLENFSFWTKTLPLGNHLGMLM